MDLVFITATSATTTTTTHIKNMEQEEESSSQSQQNKAAANIIDMDDHDVNMSISPRTAAVVYASGPYPRQQPQQQQQQQQSISPKNAPPPPSRPTRESVLQRLSEALLRRSLTKIDLSQRGLIASDARLVKMALLQNRQTLLVLNLGYNNLGNEGAAILASGIMNTKDNNLQSLDLGFNNIGDAGCTALCQSIMNSSSSSSNTNTITTTTSGGGGGGGNQQHSCCCCCLHTLYLAGNLIGEEGAMAVADLLRRGTTQLRKLYLTGNLLGPDGVKAIAEAILEDEQRRSDYNNHHSISNNDDNNNTILTDPPEEEAADGRREKLLNSRNTRSSLLRNNNAGCLRPPPPQAFLQELYLGGAGMGAVGCQALARLLQHSTRIRVLSLPNCDIDDDSLSLLAESIRTNRKFLPLESLQLSFNKITCRGIESLSNAVWGSTTLKELLLDNNEIADRGVQHIAAVLLPHVQTLETLNVGFNSIKSSGIKMLMKGVVDSGNLRSLSVSGNAIDVDAAKAMAYTLASNRSLTSLSLFHCNITHEGQRHLVTGIVSNSRITLREVTGFPMGPIVVQLGFPPSFEQWHNNQILRFIKFMWQHNRDTTNHRMAIPPTLYENPDNEEKMTDPLNFLDPLGFLDDNINDNSNYRSHTTSSQEEDSAIVVEVAKRAYSSLVAEGLDLFSDEMSSSSELREISFGSPIVSDGIILESPLSSAKTDVSDFKNNNTDRRNGTTVNGRPSTMPTRKVASFVARPEESRETILPDPERKKRIVAWLSENMKDLQRLSSYPFNAGELWKLHQHYFTPVVNESGGESMGASPNPSYGSVGMTISSVPEVSRTSTTDGRGDTSTANGESSDGILLAGSLPQIKESPNQQSSLPLLKRKVSYKFLGDATLPAYPACPADRVGGGPPRRHDQPVSMMIEGGMHSMPPKTKRARRNRSRISFLPRIKAKLDSYLDVCHEKALIIMRQLYFVEQAILSGKVNLVDPRTTQQTTHLCGILANDAEMIIVDML